MVILHDASVIAHGFILLSNGYTGRGSPRPEPRDINVRHTPRNIVVCPSHNAQFRGVSVTTRLPRGVSVTHCAISRCVDHNQVMANDGGKESIRKEWIEI